MKMLPLKREISLNCTYDVIVVGGGPAGCTAAAAAARAGAKTLLLEQTGALGGMGTQGLIPFWCPFSDGQKMIYRGLAEHVFRAAHPAGSHCPPDRLDWVAIDAEKLKRVYDTLQEQFQVDVLFFSTVCSVEMASGNRMDAIIVGSRAGLTAYRAKTFIDATGDGDIAAWASCPFERGDEHGELQCSTLCFDAGNVNAYYFQHSNWRHRDCVTGGSPFRHPTVSEHFCIDLTGPDTVGFNTGHFDGFRSDDIPAISRGMMEGRRLANDTVEDLAAHAPEVFGAARVGVTAGLMGIREGRRIHAEHTISWEDYRTRRSFEDEIARNCYYIDIHGLKDPATQEMLRKDAYGPGESHGIPYRSLIPQNVGNLLLSGRCISSDRIVYGSVRVMPVCLVTGEAAGQAAALAVRNGDGLTRNVDADELRAALRSHGAWFE